MSVIALCLLVHGHRLVEAGLIPSRTFARHVAGNDGGQWPVLPTLKVLKEGQFLEVAKGTKSFEAVFTSPGSTTIFVGGVRLRFSEGKVAFRDAVRVRDQVVSNSHGSTIDLVGIVNPKTIDFYVDGKHLAKLWSVSKPMAVQFGIPSEPWTGRLVGLAFYPAVLDPAQIKQSSAAALPFAGANLAPTTNGAPTSTQTGPSSPAGPPTPTGTLTLELGAFTPVPDPARMKPYRTALIAQEYKVLGIMKGRLSGIKVGDTIRVFRFGVVDAKKTALKDMKTGDKATFTIELLSADENLEREYQLDTLNTSYGAYYVEIPGS